MNDLFKSARTVNFRIICKSMQKVGVCLLFLLASVDVFSQSAQVVNPQGGTGLNDGLKIVVNPDATFSVYRNNQTQYYPINTWPDGAGKGVPLVFRFSQGSTYRTNPSLFEVCSSTPVVQQGNDWSASFSGHVTSSYSNEKFYVTINFTYTHPNNYFLVDYVVRAPMIIRSTETIHMYLSHDANILGGRYSRGFTNTTATGQFVGNYRNMDDDETSCHSSNSNAITPSVHGFKTKGGFRSYYTAPYSLRNQLASDMKLKNTLESDCHDNGIAVEFTVGPLAASETKGVRIMYGYGNTKEEFDDVVVGDPILAVTSTPVTVNFASSQMSEREKDDSHTSENLRIMVSGGVLLEDQVCSFEVCDGGSAVEGSDYSYVSEFTIPAGDYKTMQILTLDNFTIVGNTTENTDKTVCLSIKEDLSCIPLIIKGMFYPKTTFTILDDDKELIPGTITAGSDEVCYNTIPSEITGETSSGGYGSLRYQWQRSPDNSSWSDVPNATSPNYTPRALIETTYFRRITTDGASHNATSNVVEIKVVSIPGNLQARSIRTNTASLSWTGNSASYLVTVGASQYTVSTNGLDVDNLTPGTTYAWSVQGVHSDGQACSSAAGPSFTTLIPITAGTVTGPTATCYNTAPSEITGAMSSGGRGTLIYKWQKSADGVNWSTIPNATGQHYTPEALTATTYFMRITSDTERQTANSNVVEIKVLTSPENLQVASVSTNTASLSWDGNSSSYLVTVNGDIHTVSANHLHLTGLTSGLTYEWNVQPLYNNGQNVCTSVAGTSFSTLVSPVPPVFPTYQVNLSLSMDHPVEALGNCVNMSPAAGIHEVEAGQAMTVSVSLCDEYDLSDIRMIINGDTIASEASGLRFKKHMFRFMVNKKIEAKVIGVVPNDKNSPAGNTQPQEGHVKLWTSPGSIYISQDTDDGKPGNIRIYALSGQLVVSEPYCRPYTTYTYEVSTGVYVVVVGDQVFKVQVP